MGWTFARLADVIAARVRRPTTRGCCWAFWFMAMRRGYFRAASWSGRLIPRPIKTDSPVDFPKRRGSDSVMLKEIRHGGTCIVARRFRWVEASRLGKVGEGGERYQAPSLSCRDLRRGHTRRCGAAWRRRAADYSRLGLAFQCRWAGWSYRRQVDGPTLKAQ